MKNSCHQRDLYDVKEKVWGDLGLFTFHMKQKIKRPFHPVRISTLSQLNYSSTSLARQPPKQESNLFFVLFDKVFYPVLRMFHLHSSDNHYCGGKPCRAWEKPNHAQLGVGSSLMGQLFLFILIELCLKGSQHQLTATNLLRGIQEQLLE